MLSTTSVFTVDAIEKLRERIKILFQYSTANHYLKYKMMLIIKILSKISVLGSTECYYTTLIGATRVPLIKLVFDFNDGKYFTINCYYNARAKILITAIRIYEIHFHSG